MSLKSIGSLSNSVLKTPKISREHLSRYSWLPDVLRLEGSVAARIVGPVLTVTIFASAVAYAWYKGHNVTMTNSVTPLLAVVVGLILVFRNSTSYDRYYEGRKDFGSMVANIRNISRLIWVNVGVPPPDNISAYPGKGKSPGSNLTASQLRQKKIKVLRLCTSFAYAVKHHLRDEPGINHADYLGVLPPSFTHFDELGYGRTFTPPPTSSPVEYENRDVETGGGRRKGSQRIHIDDSLATLPDQHTPLLVDNHRTVEFHAFADRSSLPLPLVIAHEITRLIFQFKRDGYLETVGPAGTNSMNQLVQGMVDQLTALERIANTPIPVSYGIHLKQCVTLYLFSLPFTLVRDLGWSTIPVVTVVAFTLMGIEGIANEIEIPFGQDKSDLPLDRYCAELKEEIDYIIQRLPEGGQGAYGFDDGEGDD